MSTRTVYETVQAWMPHAENDVVPEATHAMMQTNPWATAERVAAFIGRHPIPD